MVAPNMATLDQIKEVVRGETDKSRRDKRCMDNNWERVQNISAERASPSELAQESSRNFLVTFLNMLRK